MKCFSNSRSQRQEEITARKNCPFPELSDLVYSAVWLCKDKSKYLSKIHESSTNISCFLLDFPFFCSICSGSSSYNHHSLIFHCYSFLNSDSKAVKYRNSITSSQAMTSNTTPSFQLPQNNLTDLSSAVETEGSKKVVSQLIISAVYSNAVVSCI